MKDRSLAFIGISIFVAVAFIGGYTLGAVVASRASEQIAALQEPAGPSPDLTGLEARVESALDEIRTLYQGASVIASWYGAPYHGRRAADGSIYNMNEHTVAHRTAPLGVFVILENRDNGKYAVAKITDRGPYVNGRTLDVSFRLAQELGMVEQGLAVLRMTVVGRPSVGD